MANVAGDAQLFEDTFTVTDYDQGKYDRVARITASSVDNQTTMKLDINIELFPCVVGENLHVVLATSLSLDGQAEEEKGWRDIRGESTLADMYDYVCHGKIYRFDDSANDQIL